VDLKIEHKDGQVLPLYITLILLISCQYRIKTNMDLNRSLETETAMSYFDFRKPRAGHKKYETELF
jgi:hypothetical protein